MSLNLKNVFLKWKKNNLTKTISAHSWNRTHILQIYRLQVDHLMLWATRDTQPDHSLIAMSMVQSWGLYIGAIITMYLKKVCQHENLLIWTLLPPESDFFYHICIWAYVTIFTYHFYLCFSLTRLVSVI